MVSQKSQQGTILQGGNIKMTCNARALKHLGMNLHRLVISLPPSFLRVEESISFTMMDLQVNFSTIIVVQFCAKQVQNIISRLTLITLKILLTCQSSLGGFLGLYLGVSLLQVHTLSHSVTHEMNIYILITILRGAFKTNFRPKLGYDKLSDQ